MNKRRSRIKIPTSDELRLARALDVSIKYIQKELIPEVKKAVASGKYNNYEGRFKVLCVTIHQQNKILRRWAN